MSQIDILRSMTDENDLLILSAYLDMAGSIILNKCYPFGSEKHEIPEKYCMKQTEIAAYLLNKRGAEGETAHSENGISRTYESASVPPSMLRDVIPFVGTFGGAE